MTEEVEPQFESVAGVIFSCLGCVIGTGNIWRFPRIMARNSGKNGASGFFIIWCISLFTWSIPIMVIEYAIGRYVRRSPPRCFHEFMGKRGLIIGFWVIFSNFFVGAYYMVILGWCLYYIYLPMSMELPSEEIKSQQIFDSFVGSNWPFIPYAICFILALASVIGGINVIEKVNIALVPVLLVILLGIFFYSVTLRYSEYGFDFLFSSDWETLAKPSLYLDAISQNAYDTGAGGGLITAYAMYMTHDHSIMRYSLFIPLVNNYVSLIAAMTIFPTVFGLILMKNPTITSYAIVKLIKGGGVAGTGLTFIWIPIILETMGVFGRVLCSIFFVCLSFAGISAFISMLEVQTISLMEFGLQRKYAVIIMCATMFLYGCASVVKLDFLASEDTIWAFAMIVSGFLYFCLVMQHGPIKFQREIVNERKSANDFRLPFIWVILITAIVPLQAIVLIGWWLYSEITDNMKTWYIPGYNSLMLTWIEWIGLLLLCVIATEIIYKVGVEWIHPHVEDVQMTSFEHIDNIIDNSRSVDKDKDFDMEEFKGDKMDMDLNFYPGTPNEAYINNEVGNMDPIDEHKNMKGHKSEVYKVNVDQNLNSDERNVERF